jgi:hypothetical protein
MPIIHKPDPLPSPLDYVPNLSIKHKVSNNESWYTLAQRPEVKAAGMNANDLCYFNFRTRHPREINWYLKHKVGCTMTTCDGKNYVFSTSDNPGIVFLPQIGPPPPATVVTPMASAAATVRAKIAAKAMGYLHSTKWLANKVVGGFPAGSNKCNKFVYDVLAEAGATAPTFQHHRHIPAGVPLIGGAPLASWWDTTLPITAGDWANRTKKIPGWEVVTDPQPGDIVAESIRYTDATGHTGIVVDGGQSVSAAEADDDMKQPKGGPGEIILTHFGFRNKSQLKSITVDGKEYKQHGAREDCVFRRFTGQ